MEEKSFYVTGGTLHHTAPSYVERRADDELHKGLSAGQFCHVLTSRQMGKSSLMVRTAVRLRQEGVRVAILDLTALGQNLAVAQWYEALLELLGQQLDLEDELEQFWREHRHVPPLRRWMRALREVVLPSLGVQAFGRSGVPEEQPVGPERLNARTPERPPRLVIFIDEIDAVRSLAFSTDEFFAAIRECFNRRAQDPEFDRLTFCLLGVATPSDLIRDIHSTPFNIGQRIEPTDFTEEEASSLAPGLGSKGKRTAALLKRILYWTGGHPYLTQLLCQAVAEAEGRRQKAEGSQDHAMASSSGLPTAYCLLPTRLVDLLCEALFLSAGAQERNENLLFVRERILRSEADLESLLDLYGRVRSGQRVPVDDTNPLVDILRLSGIVRVAGVRRQASGVSSDPRWRWLGLSSSSPFSDALRLTPDACLQVRNRIYERVFNRKWVAVHMPEAELRRQRAAFRRGLVRAAAVSAVVIAVTVTLALSARRNAIRAERHRQTADLRAGEARDLATSLQAALRSKEEALVELREALEAARLARNEAGKEAEHARRAERGERAQRLSAVAARRGAERESLRATRAERDRTEQLWVSYLSEARARRWSGRVGQRFDSLGALARAARIRPSLALRNEAIACMALADLRVQTQSSVDAPPFWGSQNFDAELKRYARGDAQGNISIRRVTDDRELLRLPGFGMPFVACRFSPNGQFAAVKYERNAEIQFYVWDLRRREAVLKVPNGIVYFATDFSPDSQRVAVGRPDRWVFLYDLTTGQEWKRLLLSLRPRSIRFHPDGQKLAVSGPDSSTAEVRDLETGKVIASLPHAAPVWCTAWRPDGKALAAGCGDFRTYIWDVVGHQRLAVLEGHEDYVTGVAFNHVGDLLVSTSWDETTRLWDPLTGKQLVSSSGSGMEFSPDDRLLGFELKGSGVELREVASSREYRTLAWYPEGAAPLVVDFSPDGRLLAAVCANDVRLWDVADAREVAVLPTKGSHSVLFQPDGKSLITSGSTGLQRWRIEAHAPAASGGIRVSPPHEILAPPTGLTYACQSRDGRTLAVVQARAGQAYVLDPDNPTRPLVLRSRPDLNRIAISPDGHWIATGNWGQEWRPVQIWDARRGKPVRDLPVAGHGQHLAFSPDGRWLVTGVGREYCFWEVGSWRPGPRLPREAHSELPGPVAFTRDGKLAAIANSRRQVQLIDPSRGQELATLEAPDTQPVGGLCFSPDGSCLAVAEGGRASHGVRLWDLRLIRRQLRAMGLDWD